MASAPPPQSMATAQLRASSSALRRTKRICKYKLRAVATCRCIRDLCRRVFRKNIDPETCPLPPFRVVSFNRTPFAIASPRQLHHSLKMPSVVCFSSVACVAPTRVVQLRAFGICGRLQPKLLKSRRREVRRFFLSRPAARDFCIIWKQTTAGRRAIGPAVFYLL
jgi:hypothetical protein